MRDPLHSRLYMQAFVMDLLWAYDDDPTGILRERYDDVDREVIANEIARELSELFVEIYNLESKINQYDYNVKYKNIVLEKPETLILEFSFV